MQGSGIERQTAAGKGLDHGIHRFAVNTVIGYDEGGFAYLHRAAESAQQGNPAVGARLIDRAGTAIGGSGKQNT